MTKAESFKELLQIAGAASPDCYNLMLQLEARFNGVIKEFQDAGEQIRCENIQYWREVIDGTKPKYVTLDGGKTVLKITAVPHNPSPTDVILHYTIK